MQYQQQNQQRPYQPYSLMGPTPMGYQVMDAVNQPASYANQGLLGAYAPMEMGGAPTRLFGLSNFQLQPSPHYPQQYTINNYYGNGGTPNPYQSSPYQHQNQYSSSPYLAPSMPSSPLDQEMNFSNRLLSERYGNVLGQGQKNAGFQW